MRKLFSAGLRQSFIISSAIYALVALQARGQESQPVPGTAQPETGKDKAATKFIKEAADGNNMEIAMAEIGSRNSQNTEVKDFCKKLQEDHTQANKELEPIAQKYGVSITQSFSHSDQREIEKFQKMSGSEFDQTFAKQMLKDHDKD